MRNNNFDLIRLLAALQVVYCHACWHLKITTGFGDPLLLWFVNSFQGVPVFFAVSGFLISRSWECKASCREFFRKRVLRIYPGLWGQLAVAILIAVAFGAITPAVATSHTFLVWIIAQSTCGQFYNPSFMRGFGAGTLNGSLWTIPIELGFYGLCPLVYGCLINRVTHRWANVFLASFVVVSFADCYYLCNFADPNSFSTKLQMVLPFPHLYMFVIGVLLHRNFEQLRPYIENRGLRWLLAFVLYICVLNPFQFGKVSPIPLVVLGGRILLAIMALSVAYSWRSLSDKLLRSTDISYGIYLYHCLVINVLVHAGCTQQQQYLGIVIFVSCLMGKLSWHLIELPAIAGTSSRAPVFDRIEDRRTNTAAHRPYFEIRPRRSAI